MDVIRCALLLLILVTCASAAIVWERQDVEPVVRLEDTAIKVDFPFRVEDGPVTIDKITSTCSCLTAEVPTREYQAGESGTATLTFHVDDRQGIYDRYVLVHTTTGKEYRLEFRAKLPPAYTLSHPLVTWNAGEAGTSKRVRLEVHGGHRLTSVEAKTGRSGVTVEVEPVEAGRLYDLVVTRDPLAKRSVVRVVITTDHPLPARRSLALLVSLP